MAAGNIRLNEAGLQASSKKLKNHGNQLEALIKDMHKVIGGLNQSWEGDAAKAYEAQFAHLKPGLDKTRVLVEDIARQIDQTLKAAQELDTKIAGQFK